ncbi:S1-C subfamily serine protease [Bradyrhizobium sp. JR6.1]
MTDRPDLSTLPSYKAPKRSLFSVRKLALMASVVAGLGAATYGFSPTHSPADLFTTPAHAQVNNEVKKVQQPVGFADIVERVKPSVISVKVNIREKVAKDDSNSNDDSPFQPGSPMERFFRRFGGPDGLPPGLRGGPRGGGVVTGQGSGFFISADGFAVTNNHVVDGADKVEVTTDDGKTYSAKVIGTDPRTDLALIKVEGGSNFQFAKLSDTKPRIGDWVLAVGNPFGLGGTVTARHRLRLRPRHRQRSVRRFHPDRCAREQGQFGRPGVRRVR